MPRVESDIALLAVGSLVITRGHLLPRFHEDNFMAFFAHRFSCSNGSDLFAKIPFTGWPLVPEFPVVAAAACVNTSSQMKGLHRLPTALKRFTHAYCVMYRRRRARRGGLQEAFYVGMCQSTIPHSLHNIPLWGWAIWPHRMIG